MNYARDIEVRRMVRERMERMEDIARERHDENEQEKYDAAQQIQLRLPGWRW